MLAFTMPIGFTEILKAGANGGKPQALHNLPSHLISIEAARTFPMAPLAYNIFTQGDKFTREEVLHEKYFNPECQPTALSFMAYRL